MMIRLAKETGARVHIVHLAAIEALPLIEAAQAAGVAISVETCPHYVAFDAVPGQSYPFKCAPPIRSGLRPALSRIGMVVSDHRPRRRTSNCAITNRRGAESRRWSSGSL